MPLSYSILNHRKLENKLKYKFENRRYVIGGAVIALVIIFIVRLFYLQIIDSDYKAWADSNAFLKKTIYPSRGILYDRNEKLLVYNQPSYDVMMIMREVQPFDTLDFCRILGITKEQYLKRIADMKNRRLNPGYSSYTPQIFMSQLSAEECGILQEKLYKFPGFYVQNRTIREYAYPNAALLLGNVGEVNTRDIEADSYYVPGDNSGRTGIEGSYEKVLRGEKGVEILLRDAHGRIKGHYEDGKYDVPAVSGKNLKLSIDINLQAYGEKLMKNKLGGIVMIEPETGEILCMVSSPTYDPSLLVGRIRGKNYKKLQEDPLKPLFNRPLMAQYPPGSTFKPTQGLIFLQEGVITPETRFTCAHGYTYRGGKPACHGHPSPLPLVGALATSCNSFFLGDYIICSTTGRVIPVFSRHLMFGRTTWYLWAMDINLELICREKNGDIFRIVRCMIRFTGKDGIQVRLFPSPLVREKYWLLHCRFVIWRQRWQTGDIMSRLML